MGKNKTKNKLKIKQIIPVSSNTQQVQATIQTSNPIADSTARQFASIDNKQNIENNSQRLQNQGVKEANQTIGQQKVNQKVQIGNKIQKQMGNQNEQDSTENLLPKTKDSTMSQQRDQLSKEQSEWKAEQNQQTYRPFKIQKQNTPTCNSNSNGSNKGENQKKEISELKRLCQNQIKNLDTTQINTKSLNKDMNVKYTTNISQSQQKIGQKNQNQRHVLDEQKAELFSPLNSSDRSSRSSKMNLSALSTQPIQMYGKKDNIKVIKRPTYSRGGSPRSSSLNSTRNMPFNYNSKDENCKQSDGNTLWSSEDKHSSISFDASVDNSLNLYDQYIQYQEEATDKKDQEMVYFEIFESYRDDLDFMDGDNGGLKVQIKEKPVQTQSQKVQQKETDDAIKQFETKLENEQIEYKKEQCRQIQIQQLIDLQGSFNKDKQEIQDKMARCLISIYNQQDMSHYFSDMIQISKIMKLYFDNSKVLLNNKNQFASLKGQSLFRLFQQIEVQASPKYLKKIMTDIIGDIMNNICEQILQKMKQLGVLIKEPLNRRASYDDYQLCFENFSKKPSNGQNQNQQNIFGYGFGNQGVFTSQINLRNLNDSKNDKTNARNKNTNGTAANQNNNLGYYNSLNFAYKQQQEMHLESSKNYEYIRKEGKKATWDDIWSSRKRLQRFIHRQNEYKKIFDLILQSYRQLKHSLEHLEEFWMYLNESIYNNIETGQLQFDRIWKDLYNERILENKFIKHFLNDVSEQYDGLQTYHQKQVSQSTNRYILDEIYENLVKLETDLNQDYVMEEFLNLDALVTEEGCQEFLQQQLFDTSTDINNEYQNLDENTLQQQKILRQQFEYVIKNQYGLIYDKLKTRYGGKSLSQLIMSATTQKPENIYKGIQQVQKLCEQYQQQFAQAQALESHNFTQTKNKIEQGTQASIQNQKQKMSSAKKKRSNKKKQAAKKEPEIEVQPSQEEEKPRKIIDPYEISRKLNLQIPASQQPHLRKKFAATADKAKNKQIQESLQVQNEEEKAAEKKKKLNQKKKRQRLEKKKREQEQNELMIQQQAQLQQQQDMEDQQLLELIYRYDENITESDKDYLMQLEDREQVINTLQAKLIERDNPHLINLRGEGPNGDVEYQYDDQYYEQYGEEDDFNSAGVEGDEDDEMANVYFQQNDQLQMLNYVGNNENLDALQDRQKLGLLHNSNFQMQNTSKNRSNQRQMSSDRQSEESFEEEIYDSKFEEELKQFQKKLEVRENSLDGQIIDTKRRNGSVGRQTRKLIPNVSPDWIDKLRRQLREQYICKSQDDQIEQVYHNSNEYSQYFLQYPAPHKHFNDMAQGGGKVFQTSRMKDIGKLAFAKCLTSSTAGISFNSPPATDRAYGYEFDPNGGQIVDVNSMEAAQFYCSEEYPIVGGKNISSQAHQNVQNSDYINIEDEDQKKQNAKNQQKVRNSDVSCQNPVNNSSQNIDQEYLCVASQHQSV